MKKHINKIVGIILSTICLTGFAFMAIGSNSEQTNIASKALQGGAQGYQQSSEGRHFIGHYGSKSACQIAAESRGCTGSWRYYESTGNCFCD